jgi:hypothetical protein
MLRPAPYTHLLQTNKTLFNRPGPLPESRWDSGNEPLAKRRTPVEPVLIAIRLLKPLGSPPPNSVEFFAALEVLESAKDCALACKGHTSSNSALAEEQRGEGCWFAFATVAGCGLKMCEFTAFFWTNI